MPQCVQQIDPWSVSAGADGKIDYNKLLEQVRGHTVLIYFQIITNNLLVL